MRHGFRIVVVGLVIAAVWPALAADGPKPASTQINWAAEVTGKLTKVDLVSKTLTLQVDVLDVDRNRNMNNNRGPNRNRRPNLPRLTIEHKDVDFQAADDVRVRTLKPAEQFDEKGNIRQYTAKELAEMKGPGNLPGYTASFDALHAGQIVKVYLAAKQPIPANPAAKEKGAAARPLVALIMIVQEGQDPTKNKQMKKNK
ncbi:MAG: hypothetical protein NZ700_08135 [Gemmataceae bacterium]|nr:hypothetical protein [Gemmataceae bacterium]MDW8264374.1 hypothetical protein [Gemmataceae bacterium]